MALWEGGVRSADVVAAGAEKIDEKESNGGARRSNPATRKNPLGFLDGDGNGDDATKTAGFTNLAGFELAHARRSFPLRHFSVLLRAASENRRRVCFASSLARRRLDFASGDSESPPIAREKRRRRANDSPARVLDLLRLVRADSNGERERESSERERESSPAVPRCFVSSRVSRTITSRRSRASRVWFGVRPD